MADGIKKLNKQIASFMLVSLAISVSASDMKMSTEQKVMYATPDIEMPVQFDDTIKSLYAVPDRPVFKIKRYKRNTHILMYGVPSIQEKKIKDISDNERIEIKEIEDVPMAMYAPPEYFEKIHNDDDTTLENE